MCHFGYSKRYEYSQWFLTGTKETFQSIAISNEILTRTTLFISYTVRNHHAAYALFLFSTRDLYLNNINKIDELISMAYGIEIDVIVVYVDEFMYPTRISKYFQLYKYHIK